MNSRWIAVSLALLCFAQVWAKPGNKAADDSDYQEDDVQEERGTDYTDEDGSSSGPVVALSQTKTIFALPGSDVSLPCEFQNAESLAIEWRTGSNVELYMDTLKVTQDDRISRGATNNTLTIRNVNLNDTGEYMCTATSTPPVVIAHKLFVQPKGVHVRVLPNVENDVQQGTSITITCQAGEELKPQSMYWSRLGHRLKSEESQTDGQVRAISLAIKNATRHVAGDYQCVVEVGADRPIVKHLRLRVHHKPEIEYDTERVGEHTYQIRHYATSIGADANITCVIHAHPGITKLTWIHDGSNVKIDGMHYFKEGTKEHKHILGIKNVTKADFGSWRCRAYNLLDEGVGPEIVLSDSPGQPRFHARELVDDAIEFQWKVISYKPLNHTEFLYRKEGDGDDAWKLGTVKITSGIGKEHVIVTRLRDIEPGKYEAKLRVSNDAEHQSGPDVVWGPYSEVKKFNGEHENAEPSTGKGTAALATSSLMSLLLIVTPLTYACL